MPCEAPSRAVSMPRHTRHGHGHATPHQQKFERERKNRSKGRRAIHSFHIHIHSFILPHQARVSFLQWEGGYDVTPASLAFCNSRPLLFSDRPSCFDETRRPQRSWDWRNPVIISISFCTLFHMKDSPHSAPHPSHPFRFRCEQESFFWGAGTRDAKGSEALPA
jgi:hypothetical protein